MNNSLVEIITNQKTKGGEIKYIPLWRWLLDK